MTKPDYKSIPYPYHGSGDHAVFIRGTELDTYRNYRRFDGFEQRNYVICNGCSLIFANRRM